MRISVSVAGSTATSSNTVRCGAEFEVEAIDQGTIERMVHAVRQCDTVIRGTGHQMQGSSHEASAASESVPRRSSASGKRLATEKQVKAIEAMARRQRIDLRWVLKNRFGVSQASELSIGDASAMIDELKQPAADHVGSG